MPNKILTFDDRDPPWMTEYIKSKIHWKNCIYNQYVNSLRNHVDYDILQQAISEVSELVDNAKNNYYNLANTLSNPSSSSKTYWSILKLFCNNKKIPLIPPILVGNKLESDFKLKANYFNKYFASKCTPMNNDSSLSSSFEFYSQSRLSSLNIIEDNILKIVRALNINKAHGHDEISVRMIKICDEALVKLLSLMNKNCIDTGVFPDIWKKSNIVPVYKRGDKQIIDNYRPISLLCICGKIFEKILFNSIYDFLEENNLLCEHQSGFRPSDSCEYQLLSIVHDIYASFDCSPPLDARGIYLDISNAFDRVWHDGLIYKVKSIRINGMFLKLITNFLKNRFQSCFKWSNILTGTSTSRCIARLCFRASVLPYLYK